MKRKWLKLKAFLFGYFDNRIMSDVGWTYDDDHFELSLAYDRGRTLARWGRE